MSEYCQLLKRWKKAIVEHDGSYPDPIDNCPCEYCSQRETCHHQAIQRKFQ